MHLLYIPLSLHNGLGEIGEAKFVGPAARFGVAD